MGNDSAFARAAVAGKMVIASDAFVMGRRGREHRLGLLFPSENAGELSNLMHKAAMLSDSETASYRANALEYARLCSRNAFRKALLAPYGFK